MGVGGVFIRNAYRTAISHYSQLGSNQTLTPKSHKKPSPSSPPSTPYSSKSSTWPSPSKKSMPSSNGSTIYIRPQLNSMRTSAIWYHWLRIPGLFWRMIMWRSSMLYWRNWLKFVASTSNAPPICFFSCTRLHLMRRILAISAIPIPIFW